MTRLRTLLWPILLTLLTFSVLTSVLSWQYHPIQSDETSLAWIGKQVAYGRVPYRDFFTLHPPLTTFGLGAYFKAFGASLAALRILALLSLTAGTLLFYALLRRLGWKPPWAAGIAFQLPALVVPFWPLPSHHWFALVLGLAALWMTFWAMEDDASVRWFAAGFFSAMCCLCLQTDGLFFAVSVGALALSRGIRTPGAFARLATLAAGASVPVVLAVAALLIQGSLDDAVYTLVTWPAKFYKQPGGFNDVKLWEMVPEILRVRTASSSTGGVIAAAATMAGVLSLGLWSLLAVTASGAWTEAQKRPPGRWLASAASLAAALLVFLNGRPDWNHLAMAVPLFLLPGLLLVDGDRRGAATAGLKGLVVVLTVMALLRWPALWFHQPPRLVNVLDVDAQTRLHSTPSLLLARSDIVAGRKPVLCLPTGGELYFYWAPVPPPLDWVYPPSAKGNAPWEYKLLATFADEHRVPYILIRTKYTDAFLSDPSPLADLLRSKYRLAARLPMGDLFERATP